MESFCVGIFTLKDFYSKTLIFCFKFSPKLVRFKVGKIIGVIPLCVVIFVIYALKYGKTIAGAFKMNKPSKYSLKSTVLS